MTCESALTARPVAPRAAVAADVEPDADFRDFYVTEFPRIARYCTRLTGDSESGADVAQEACIRTYTRWFRVQEPKAYAFLVATNLVRKRWQAMERERVGRAKYEQQLAGQPRVGAPQDLVLRDLVDRLPDRLRDTVLLYYYADLPVADVARVLRRPVGTVKQRLNEARSVLRLDLERPDE